jgi:hypothetical protein
MAEWGGARLSIFTANHRNVYILGKKKLGTECEQWIRFW